MKRIVAILLIVVVVVTLALPCFASSAAAVAAIDYFLTSWTTYSAAHGLDVVLSSNGSNASTSQPISIVGLRRLADQLYNGYKNAVVDAAGTVEDWYDTYSDGLQLVGDQQQSQAQYLMESELVGFFDRFSNWLLGDQLQLDRNDAGFAHSSGSFAMPLVSDSSTTYCGVELDPIYVGQVISLSPFDGVSPFQTVESFIGDDLIYVFRSANMVYLVSNSAFSFSLRKGSYLDSYGSTLSSASDAAFPFWYSSFTAGTVNPSLPLIDFPTGAGGVPTVNQEDTLTSSSSMIRLRPQDKYNEQSIPVPDVNSETYEPDTLTGSWAVPADPAASLPSVLDQLMALIGSNEGVLADEKTNPPGGDSDDENSSNADDYQALGLKDVFPFCIPFDLYNFFACLAADPVAPEFEIPFVIPGLVDYTFEIDLSEWETVALLLRRLELLGFCVALVLITRSHMIRG